MLHAHHLKWLSSTRNFAETTNPHWKNKEPPNSILILGHLPPPQSWWGRNWGSKTTTQMELSPKPPTKRQTTASHPKPPISKRRTRGHTLRSGYIQLSNLPIFRNQESFWNKGWRNLAKSPRRWAHCSPGKMDREKYPWDGGPQNKQPYF